MTEHNLKVDIHHWGPLKDSQKNFEVRRDDRGFQKGDVLVLTPVSGAVVEPIRRRVTWILTGGQFGIEAGYVVMGLRDEGNETKAESKKHRGGGRILISGTEDDLVYLATPYTGSPKGKEGAYMAAQAELRSFLESDIAAISPVVHTHICASRSSLCNKDSEFWLKMDFPLLRAATILMLVLDEGWESSEGMKAEYWEAVRLGIPVQVKLPGGLTLEARVGDVNTFLPPPYHSLGRFLASEDRESC